MMLDVLKIRYQTPTYTKHCPIRKHKGIQGYVNIHVPVKCLISDRYQDNHRVIHYYV